MKMKGIDYDEFGLRFWIIIFIMGLPFLIIFLTPILLIILANILMFFGLI
ncbi:MAG: hypothetical protein ACOX8U_10305 [Bradymonadia bacterium]